MKLSLADLQLQAYRLLSLIVEVSEDYDEDARNDEKYDILFDFDVYKTENEMTFIVSLIYGMRASKNCNCRLESLLIKLEGMFSLPQDASEETINKMVPYNCIAILYSLARGIISSVTGNTQHGMFLIPTVDINKVIMNKMEKNKKKEKTSKTKKRRQQLKENNQNINTQG